MSTGAPLSSSSIVGDIGRVKSDVTARVGSAMASCAQVDLAQAIPPPSIIFR